MLDKLKNQKQEKQDFRKYYKIKNGKGKKHYVKKICHNSLLKPKRSSEIISKNV